MRAIIKAISVLSIGVCIMVPAGCSVLPQSPPPLAAPSALSDPSATPPAGEPGVRASDAPSTSAVEVADGFSAQEHAAIRIRARTCDAFTVGSGFVLDDHTLITNRHVVEGAQTITLSSYDGQEYEATGSVIADFADLALVTVDATLDFAVTLAGSGPTPGDQVDIVGYPLGGPLNTRSGPYVKEVPDGLVKGRDDVDLIQVSAEHGNSGSAVYDAEGTVVGVLYATDENGESFAVTLASLNKFLSDESLQRPNDTECN